MKFQIVFSGKSKKTISLVCRLLNYPREWLILVRTYVPSFKDFATLRNYSTQINDTFVSSYSFSKSLSDI